MAGKRKQKRLSIFSEAKVRTPKGRASATAYVANISREGLGLYIPKRLSKNQEVSVELHFVDHRGRDRREKVLGKIVWCRQAYAAGIALDPLSASQNPFLTAFLKALEQEPN